MIRTLARRNVQRARARPRRPFVEQMKQLRMTRKLSRRRVLTARPVWLAPPERVWALSIPNPWDDGASSLQFDVTSTRQRLGGKRWWWICPGCGGRCAVLLSSRPNEPFRCRRCCRAVYQSDHLRRPARRDVRAVRAWTFPRPELTLLGRLTRRLAELTARRRRGVRRGRHLQRRIARLKVRIVRQQRRHLAAVWGPYRRRTWTLPSRPLNTASGLKSGGGKTVGATSSDGHCLPRLSVCKCDSFPQAPASRWR